MKYETVADIIAERDALKARLAEAERDAARYRWLRSEHDRVDPCVKASAKYNLDRNGSDWVNVHDLDATIDAARAADSASAVQPERCCLDYPRCDCNSPPEPDDDWLCFQRPAQPKVTP